MRSYSCLQETFDLTLDAINNIQLISRAVINATIWDNFWSIWQGSWKIIEVKGGWYVKKLEFDQTKKNFIYQFFKTRICAFMTYGRFLPKSSLNSSFVIRDSRFEAASRRPRTLESQMINLISEPLVSRNRP